MTTPPNMRHTAEVLARYESVWNTGGECRTSYEISVWGERCDQAWKDVCFAFYGDTKDRNSLDTCMGMNREGGKVFIERMVATWKNYGMVKS